MSYSPLTNVEQEHDGMTIIDGKRKVIGYRLKMIGDIDNYLSLGWELYGDPVFNGEHFYQAIVMYED